MARYRFNFLTFSVGFLDSFLNLNCYNQGRHGRFLAGKDAKVATTSPVCHHCTALPPPFSISQNPAKDQALVALSPVAALMRVFNTLKKTSGSCDNDFFY